MKLSLRFGSGASIGLVALAALATTSACAHRDATSARAPQATTLTSTQVPLARTSATPTPSAQGDIFFTPDPAETTPMDESVAIDAWAKRYPDASAELNDWMGHYPTASKKLAAWDANHPTRMKTLTDWAITHRYEAVGAFLYGRSGWDEFLDIAQSEPDAVAELLGWARRGSPAAVELTSHADSLSWAGKNLKARPGHVPTPAKSIAAPVPVAPDAGKRGSGGIAPPGDASPWYPSPTSMIR